MGPIAPLHVFADARRRVEWGSLVFRARLSDGRPHDRGRDQDGGALAARSAARRRAHSASRSVARGRSLSSRRTPTWRSFARQRRRTSTPLPASPRAGTPMRCSAPGIARASSGSNDATRQPPRLPGSAPALGGAHAARCDGIARSRAPDAASARSALDRRRRGPFDRSRRRPRILWLFGDTVVAKSAARSRRDAWFLHNSVGIQTGSRDPAATPRPHRCRFIGDIATILGSTTAATITRAP